METQKIPPLPRPPREADAYDVRERIAVGTGAVVYRAVEHATGDEVLFKVLQPHDMRHPLDVERVLSRRAALSKFSHPNVATLLDVFDDEEGCVLVYNYMAGKGAQLAPKDSVLTPAEARVVAHQLCDALRAAEEVHCPHGEIKPSNIVLARNGPDGPVIQVQDWGLSVCRQGEAPDESLLFMSPERLRGGEPEFQSDLFSVGATLIFLLTAHVPVQGGTREELLKAWKDFDIEALKPLRPDLEASFVQWIGWLMQADPKGRPESMEIACKALDEVIAKGETLDRKRASEAAAAFQNPRPAVTAAPRPTAPRVQLPPAARMQPQQSSQRLKPAPPTQKKPEEPATSSGSKVFGWIFALFALSGIGAFAAWAYEHRASLESSWDDWFGKKVPVETAASDKSPSATGAATASPPPTPPPEPKPAKPFGLEQFQYAAETSLDGTTGGTGWASAWKAERVKVLWHPQTKANYVSLGGSEFSVMRREIGPSASFTESGLCIATRIWHPGGIAPALELDLLDDGSGGAVPVSVTPDGNRLKITVANGKGEIVLPAAREFRLVTSYRFNRNDNGRCDVEINVSVRPPLRGRQPSCVRVLKNYLMPASLALSLRSKGTAQRGFSVNEILLAHTPNELPR